MTRGIPYRGALNGKELIVGLKRGYTISRGLVITILVCTILSVGTVGYMLIADLSFIDALYMTLITVSTVGFREVTALDTSGKVFTIIILGGLSIISYSLVELAAFFVDGGMHHIIRRRAMKKRIAELKDHIIVCGAGQTGASVLEQFKLASTDCVVIESDEERIRDLNDSSLLVIHGDATNEDVLEEAGISRARGVVCCLSTDADTVYTVLTARGMNPKLQIVARAIEKGPSRSSKERVPTRRSRYMNLVGCVWRT
ncbi:MAG: NAD-binding protein [Sphaerochaetaceae bacterium]|nr:NAD-binding protein [Sphaerochaetaceae bacterium]